MKLQFAYNRAALISTTFILILASIGDYFILRYVLLRQIDKTLKVEETEILDHVRKKNELPPASIYGDQRIEFEPGKIGEAEFRSIRVLSPEGHIETARQLRFPIAHKGTDYIAIVSKSQAETEELILYILVLTGLFILLLLSFLFLANRLFVKKIWQPFYSSLGAMKAFDLSGKETFSIKNSGIDEFNDLNVALEAMMQKIRNDYTSLKIFTENASHEMQTPLAVLTSKVDLLMQDNQENEANLLHIKTLYHSIDKLARLNKSLLLLARIGNKQFYEKRSVDIHELINEKLYDLHEIIHAKDLQVEVEKSEARIVANPELLDILLNNLLNNAIRHTASGGEIRLRLNQDMFEISNTAGSGALDESKVFDRFQKSTSSEGLGLGLAIVKEICEVQGYSISYKMIDGMHVFTIDFADEQSNRK